MSACEFTRPIGATSRYRHAAQVDDVYAREPRLSRWLMPSLSACHLLGPADGSSLECESLRLSRIVPDSSLLSIAHRIVSTGTPESVIHEYCTHDHSAKRCESESACCTTGVGGTCACARGRHRLTVEPCAVERAVVRDELEFILNEAVRRSSKLITHDGLFARKPALTSFADDATWTTFKTV